MQWNRDTSGFRSVRLSMACLLLGFAMPSPAQPKITFSVYPVPGFYSAPPGITAGPDGALWFAGWDAVWRMTTAGAMTKYQMPDDGNFYPNTRGLSAITAGPDGAVWFTEMFASKIGRITTGGTITEYPLPATDRMPGAIATGSDGALWFTEQLGQNGRIGRITTAGAVTEYAVSACPGNCAAYPKGIASGPDGALWFTDVGDGRIHRITTTGSVNDYGPVLGLNVVPVDIAVGPENALWFTAEDGAGPNDRIGRITTAGETRTFLLPIYPRPTPDGRNLGPRSIVAGSDGALWFTSLRASVLGRVTTGGEVSLHSLPPASDEGQMFRSIALGPDGALWITNVGSIVRASIDAATPPPPAPGTLTIGNYQLTGVQRGPGTLSNVTYRADLLNTRGRFGSVTATLTSLDPFTIRVLPSQGILSFNLVPANSQVTSTNQFTILTDPTVPLDAAKLLWTFQTTPAAPVANAGPNQTVNVGSNVVLDASSSTDSSGTGALSYDWRFTSRPPGTFTRLFYTTTVSPTFLADAPGTYVLALIVSDGAATSTTAVTITAVTPNP